MLCNGRDVEARALIKKISKDTSATDAALDAKMIVLKSQTKVKTKSITLIDSMCNPLYRRATWTCLILAIFAMQSGLTGIGVYMHRLITMANKSGALALSSTAATAIYGASDFAGAFGAMVVMQCFARKTVFIMGFALMSSLLSLSAVFLIYEDITLMFISLCCFVFCFASFVGAVLWLYVGECA